MSRSLTGERFGRLTAVSRLPARNRHRYWRCRCSCGAWHEAREAHLRSGSVQSCGCLRRDQCRKVGKRSGAANIERYHERRRRAESEA